MAAKLPLTPPSTYDRRQGGGPPPPGEGADGQHISISARSKSVWRIRSEVSLSWILPVETGSTVSLVVGTNLVGFNC